jgi:DNA repair protein RecO (recombination protein O)
MLRKDQAVCLRAVDFSETSQVVTFFGRDSGKVSLIAKGAKRAKSAFSGPIEIFCCGPVVFADPGREKLATLTEFEPVRVFSGLRKSLFALNGALFAAELVGSFTADFDPHPELYDRLVGFLGNCENAAEKTAVLRLLIMFQLELLQLVGTGLVLGHCVNCEKAFSESRQHLYFSSQADGLICWDCEASFPDKVKLTLQAARCLSNPGLISKASEAALGEIEGVLIHHFTEVLHRPPKMAKYFSASQAAQRPVR